MTLVLYFQVFCQGTVQTEKQFSPFFFLRKRVRGLSIRLGGLGECKKTSYNVNSCIYKQQFLNRPALFGNNLILLKSDFKTFKKACWVKYWKWNFRANLTFTFPAFYILMMRLYIARKPNERAESRRLWLTGTIVSVMTFYGDTATYNIREVKYWLEYEYTSILSKSWSLRTTYIRFWTHTFQELVECVNQFSSCWVSSRQKRKFENRACVTQHQLRYDQFSPPPR